MKSELQATVKLDGKDYRIASPVEILEIEKKGAPYILTGIAAKCKMNDGSVHHLDLALVYEGAIEDTPEFVRKLSLKITGGKFGLN